MAVCYAVWSVSSCHDSLNWTLLCFITVTIFFYSFVDDQLNTVVNTWIMYLNCAEAQEMFHTYERGVPQLKNNSYLSCSRNCLLIIMNYSHGIKVFQPLFALFCCDLICSSRSVQGSYPLSETNFQDFSRTQIDFFRTLKLPKGLDSSRHNDIFRNNTTLFKNMF